MLPIISRNFSSKVVSTKKNVAIIGGGTAGRLLSYKLRDSCNVSLISKFKYTLDDYYKLTNAVRMPKMEESNISYYSGTHFDLIIDDV